MAVRIMACIGLLIISGCSASDWSTDPDRTAAALAILGGGMQNYGAQRASYQPVYQPAVLCQPVGRTVMCY